MGARGNIEIKQEGQDTSIFFYTHWNGHNIQNTLAAGLRKAQQAGRIDDSAYATRIIYDTLLDGDTGTTGYGITIGGMSDNEFDVPRVVWDKFGEAPLVFYKQEEYSVSEFTQKF